MLGLDWSAAYMVGVGDCLECLGLLGDWVSMPSSGKRLCLLSLRKYQRRPVQVQSLMLHREEVWTDMWEEAGGAVEKVRG